MQLKLKRTQRDGGVISKTAIFCLDARVEFTAEEQKSITRYKLQSQVIYNSEASKRLLDKSAAQQDGSTMGSLKSLATIAFAATKLNITIIEGLIRHDLASIDPPSIVLLDPHSDLVRKLTRSDLGLEDRLILIDPRDTKFPVALNPFAVNRERLATYDDATREQVTAGVIQTFGYLFSGLTNLTLTGKQEVFFRYVTRLMLSLPETMGRNATILDMLSLMADPAPYGAAIAALPDIQRDFFARDFMGKSFEGTKEQIRYRLQAIIESPTMAPYSRATAPESRWRP